MAGTFEQRRNVILEKLRSLEGFTCQKPGGAFYLFPNISGLCENFGVFEAFRNLPGNLKKRMSPSTFFQMFAHYEHGVAIMDRKSFGAIGAEDLHFLRISIASDLEKLEEGVRRIAAAGGDVKGFERLMESGKLHTG
jgi:aspartate aminotransferase